MVEVVIALLPEVMVVTTALVVNAELEPEPEPPEPPAPPAPVEIAVAAPVAVTPAAVNELAMSLK
jgi:hypothetical protein